MGVYELDLDLNLHCLCFDSMNNLYIRFLGFPKRIYLEISIFCDFLFFLIRGRRRSTFSEELSQAEIMAMDENNQALESARGEVLGRLWKTPPPWARMAG
jgi:hypothetical protein